jgi:hypothetical protein
MSIQQSNRPEDLSPDLCSSLRLIFAITSWQSLLHKQREPSPLTTPSNNWRQLCLLTGSHSGLLTSFLSLDRFRRGFREHWLDACRQHEDEDTGRDGVNRDGKLHPMREIGGPGRSSQRKKSHADAVESQTPEHAPLQVHPELLAQIWGWQYDPGQVGEETELQMAA